jgi:hypothetical protein
MWVVEDVFFDQSSCAFSTFQTIGKSEFGARPQDEGSIHRESCRDAHATSGL